MKINNITTHEHNNRPGDSTTEYVAIYHKGKYVNTVPRDYLERYFRTNYFERGRYDIYPRKSMKRNATFTKKRYGDTIDLTLHYLGDDYQVMVTFDDGKLKSVIYVTSLPFKIAQKMYRKILSYSHKRYLWAPEATDNE